MSTGAIIAIVAAVVLIALVVAIAIPRMRGRRREQHLAERREAVAGAHREAAEERFARAEIAEREARLERAKAELHESRAHLTDQGLADDQLDRERDGGRDGDPDRFGRDGERERPRPLETESRPSRES